VAERLSRLMHAEVDALDIPAPSPRTTLATGRRLRRRHNLTVAVVGATAVAAVACGTLFWANRPAVTVVDPVTPHSAPAPPAYGVGSRVVLGDEVAQVPDTVHSLHYTSVGVLVRSNPNDGASDGSGPESLTLVQDDGTTVDLGTVPEGVGPATDPEQPYFALAERSGDGFEAVVRDARTGDEVGRVALPDLPPSYWEVPPLGLSGDHVYVGYRSKTVAVDWHTGDNHVVAGLTGGIPEVYGGHALIPTGDTATVIDAATGEELAEFPVTGDPADGEGGVDLSPDGRFALVWHIDPQSYEPARKFTVVDIASGGSQPFDGAPYDWGWTADGGLFTIQDGTVAQCAPATGECTEARSPVNIGSQMIRLGGRMYES